MFTKQCIKCKVWKSHDSFHVNRRRRDGLQSTCKECIAQYYIKNRERLLEYGRSYYQKNRLKCLQYAHSEKGHEYRRITKHRRRALKKTLPHTLTPKEWQSILEKYDHRCAYCGKPESSDNKFHQEHIVPISRGGGYTALNIVPSCSECNLRKGAKTPVEAGMKLARIKLKQLSLL